MKSLSHWVKLPTFWIEMGRLKEFQWHQGQGSDELAALMLHMIISHHANQHDGIARLSYDDFSWKTALSRAKISGGLGVLEGRGFIRPKPQGRSTYRLTNYDPDKNWAKFPASPLYDDSGTVAAFRGFTRRSRIELNALKLYFLFASRRDRNLNMAKISYDKIVEYSGISRNEIKRALSVLTAQGLIHIEHMPSSVNDAYVANAYRLAHLEPYINMGTTGRSILGPEDLSDDIPF